MVIGIDASRTTTDLKTGVEYYAVEIIRELAKLDTSNEYRLYSWEPLKGDLATLPPNFVNIIVPARRAWPHTSLSLELRRNPVDRLFIPSHVVPMVHPRNTIVTIHDVGFRHFRENYSWYHYLSLMIGTKLSAKWASRIVVPSQTVAADVRDYYPQAAGKIEVIPNGYDQELYQHISAKRVVDVMKNHRIEDPYLLFLGRLEVRKNVGRIIEAFYRLQDSGLFGGQLVLIGQPGVGYEAIRDLVGKQRRANSVVVTGYVSPDERAALLRGARAFVFPSLYEGFGIPILEAFGAGTPVLTSRGGATEEVAGDGALLVDPDDVEAIHQGMQKLLADEVLVKKLVAAGTARLERYGWDKTAREIHRVLTA